MSRLACGASVLLATAASVVGAETCAETGQPPVAYGTLMASTTNAAGEWWYRKDCTVDAIAVRRGGSLVYDNGGVEQVLSVPSDTTSISLFGSSLARGADFSTGTKVSTMTLSATPTDPSKFVLPPSLQSIVFVKDINAQLQSLDGVRFPSTLTSFTIRSSGLTSLANAQFPSSLQSLEISESPLSSIDFPLPASLRKLSFSGVSVGKMDQLILPSGLESFKVQNGGSVSIRGVQWPTTLKTLEFSQTSISVFEISQSDVAIFKRLGSFVATVSQTACARGASLETIGSVRLCVVADAESNGGSPASSPTTRKPANANNPNGGTTTTTSGGGSAEGSDGGAASGGGEKNSPSRPSGSVTPGGGPSEGSTTESSTGVESNDMPASGSRATTSGSNGSSPAARRSRPQDAPPASSDATTQSSSSGPNVGTIAVIAGCGLLVVVGGIVYWVCARAKSKHADDDVQEYQTTTGKYTRSTTPTGSSQTLASREPYGTGFTDKELSTLSSVDFRDDKELVRCRIDNVTIGKQIARGGYGIVYRGSYQGRVVAIKQMLPDAWRNDSQTAAFVAEIRICARLNHPKIVEFVGVSWSGVRDLSAVSEYMEGGDLHSVLRTYSESTGDEWTSSWTSRNLRSKTLIAVDVAEAVVYLHSLETPVIHRDLKTKNVLLDLVGNAKLSDFGISREMSLDETMTGEIGTAAWIAPEVLRGERYGEKADIYSLGVLLVELDRCSHPYADDPSLLMASMTRAAGRGHSSGVVYNNTQIAILVSTGKLKPTPTLECPLEVAALVARCLSLNVQERPTAVEVLHALQRIQETLF